MDIEIITSRDLAENRGWPRPRPRVQEPRVQEPRVQNSRVPDMGTPQRTELDCRTCTAPASACSDCVMGVLLQVDGAAPSAEVLLTPEEQRAVEALSGVGLLPPLRHQSAS